MYLLLLAWRQSASSKNAIDGEITTFVVVMVVVVVVVAFVVVVVVVVVIVFVVIVLLLWLIYRIIISQCVTAILSGINFD